RRRPDLVGDLDHDLAAIGDATLTVGARLRHQHHELWRPSARLRARRDRRRTLRRRSLPLSRRRDLCSTGAGDPAVARGVAGAAARDGGLAGAVLIGTSFRGTKATNQSIFPQAARWIASLCSQRRYRRT